MVILQVFAGLCQADTFSLTGSLLSPEDTFQFNFALTTPGTVTVQTYGFGGGANAAGTTIPAGGFDPFVGLFSNSGAGLLFVNGDSDILSDYSPGCPPAGSVTIGSVAGQCGDVFLEFAALPAGQYTLLLSDGAYLPNAVFESGPAFLADGFTDLTGGAFQTCYNADNCNLDTAAWALDVTAPDSTFTPEPGSAVLCLTVIAFAFSIRGRRFFTKIGDQK